MLQLHGDRALPAAVLDDNFWECSQLHDWNFDTLAHPRLRQVESLLRCRLLPKLVRAELV